MGWKDRITADKPTTSSWRDRIQPDVIEEALTPVDQIKENDSQLANEFDKSAKVITSVGAGYGVGGLASDKLESLAKDAIPKIDNALVTAASAFSDYTPEQLREIKSRFNEYQSLDPNKAFVGLEKTAGATNELANQLEKQAYEQLDTKKISPSQFSGIVEKTLQAPLLTSKLPSARDLSEETLKQIESSAIEGTNPLKQRQLQDQLSSFAEERAKQAVEVAKNSSMGLLPQDAESAIMKQVLEDTKVSPAGFAPSLDQEALLQEYQKLKDSRLSKESTPLAKDFPNLKGKTIASDIERDFRRTLGAVAPGADVTGSELYGVTKNLRGKGFSALGEVQSEYPAAAQKVVREEVANLSPEASSLLGQESEQIGKLNKLESTGYITKNADVTRDAANFIQVTPKNIDKLTKDLMSKDGVKLTEAATSLEELKNYLSPEQLDEIKFAVLKQAENNSPGIGIPSSNLNSLMSLLSKNKGARMVATAPEMLADAAQMVGKYTPDLVKSVAKGTVKYGPRVAGTVAGGLVGFAAQAAEEGFDSEDVGGPLEQAALLRESDQAKRQSNVEKKFPQLAEEYKKLNEGIRVSPGETLKVDKLKNLEDLQAKFKSMSGSKGAEAISPILDSALSGTPEEKAKAEFQINQNPWLRNKVNKE